MHASLRYSAPNTSDSRKLCPLDRQEDDHCRKNRKLFSKTSAQTAEPWEVTEMTMKANHIQENFGTEVLHELEKRNSNTAVHA